MTQEELNYLKKAAVTGDVKAQIQLATAYCNGKDLPQNHVEASKWFLKAAEHGFGKHNCLVMMRFHLSLRKIFLAFMMLFLGVNLAAQTAVTLETDELIKITVPKEYEMVPIQDKEEGPYKKWVHLRLKAISKDHVLLAYTVIRKMPKEGRELSEEMSNVEMTDSFVCPGLENMTLLRHEHPKWYHWGKPWSKKTYQAQDSSWYAVSFVSRTETHMIVVWYVMDDLEDMEEFDDILRSIEYRKGFLFHLNNFMSDHEFLASLYFIVCIALIGAGIVEGLGNKKTTALLLLGYLALMGWLLFAFEGDWLFVGVITFLGVLVIIFGKKLFG